VLPVAWRAAGLGSRARSGRVFDPAFFDPAFKRSIPNQEKKMGSQAHFQQRLPLKACRGKLNNKKL